MVPRKPAPRVREAAARRGAVVRFVARLATLPILRRLVPARRVPPGTRQPD